MKGKRASEHREVPSGSVMVSRREILSFAVIAAAAAAFPAPLLGAVGKPTGSGRSLAFYNTHTGESLDVCYCPDGSYDPEALARIDHILRDHRTGDTLPIDRGLLDLLHALQSKTGGPGPYHVISGYRSPRTNARLRRRSGSVAGRSLHLVGKAIDVRLPGCRLNRLHDAALDLRGGGVGFYPRSDFVHVDVGRVRRWSG